MSVRASDREKVYREVGCCQSRARVSASAARTDAKQKRVSNSPDGLNLVLLQQIARKHHVQTCLDFGSGVGSGALLFTRTGVAMTLADISTTLSFERGLHLLRRGKSLQQ
jgi:hypothetical protein